ncbi:hypothetical protein D3C71_2008020 [compost metagenome]
MTESELIHTVKSPEVLALTSQMNGPGLSISPYRIAEAIAYAINMPQDTSVNEIVVRPTLHP